MLLVVTKKLKDRGHEFFIGRENYPGFLDFTNRNQPHLSSILADISVLSARICTTQVLILMTAVPVLRRLNQVSSGARYNRIYDLPSS